MLKRFLDCVRPTPQPPFSTNCGRRNSAVSMPQGHVYLDFTGAGLYAACHVREHAELLEKGVFGNPHSANPTSTATTHAVESARAAVLEWFNGAGRIHRGLHPERLGRAEARRRILPVPTRRPLSDDRRQPQFGQRHPRVRRAPRARRSTTRP